MGAHDFIQWGELAFSFKPRAAAPKVKRAFLDKLLARFRRIQPEDVEAFFVELARDKRFLETIFNAIREGVIVTDTAGTVIYMNDAAGLLFGLDPAAALGRPLAENISGLRWK